MLDQPIADRITTSIAAYLTPRDRTLTDNLRAAAAQLAARGMIGSGNAAAQFARIGADELTVRAKIIGMRFSGLMSLPARLSIQRRGPICTGRSLSMSTRTPLRCVRS